MLGQLKCTIRNVEYEKKQQQKPKTSYEYKYYIMAALMISSSCLLSFVFVFQALVKSSDFTWVSLRKTAHISNDRFIHFKLGYQMPIIKISEVYMYLQNNFRFHPVCQNLYYKSWNMFASIMNLYNLQYIPEWLLSDADDVTRNLFIYFFNFNFLFNIRYMFIYSTHILKASKNCYICFYLINKENL